MYKSKDITVKEKAAIIYNIITGINDGITFYTIAKGKTEVNINRESYSNSGNKLKKQQYIIDYYNQAQNIIDNYIGSRINNIKHTDNNGCNDIDNKDNSFTLKNIDFTNITEFVTYLNNQANTIQDEKSRREYLKMLADLLRFKDGASGSNDDIQRFYTPQTCKNCMLYNLKADEISQK